MLSTTPAQTSLHLQLDAASQETEILRENEFLIILKMYQLSYLHCRRIGEASIFKEVEDFGHFTFDDDAQIELETESKIDIETPTLR